MPARFETTRWSLVLAAGESAGEASREAMAALCESYWYPIYGFVRAQGHDEDDARDLTQSYFANLLDKNTLAGLDPGAGRFRAFLLVSARNFLHNERDRQRTRKRGGDRPPLSLDSTDAEQRLRFEPLDGETPDRLFERCWAATVVRHAMQRLEQEFTASGQQRSFALLRGFLTGDAPTLPYDELARELDLGVSTVKSRVHRLRKRFGLLLRAEVSQTVNRREDIDDELRHLLQVLSEG